MTQQPLIAAATTFLQRSPAIARKEVLRYWIARDGTIDWAKARREIDAGAIRGWSSGERRIVLAALALVEIDLWGLDSGDAEALVAGLRLAADQVERDAARTAASARVLLFASTRC